MLSEVVQNRRLTNLAGLIRVCFSRYKPKVEQGKESVAPLRVLFGNFGSCCGYWWSIVPDHRPWNFTTTRWFSYRSSTAMKNGSIIRCLHDHIRISRDGGLGRCRASWNLANNCSRVLRQNIPVTDLHVLDCSRRIVCCIKIRGFVTFYVTHSWPWLAALGLSGVLQFPKTTTRGSRSRSQISADP